MKKRLVIRVTFWVAGGVLIVALMIRGGYGFYKDLTAVRVTAGDFNQLANPFSLGQTIRSGALFIQLGLDETFPYPAEPLAVRIYPEGQLEPDEYRKWDEGRPRPPVISVLLKGEPTWRPFTATDCYGRQYNERERYFEFSVYQSPQIAMQ